MDAVHKTAIGAFAVFAVAVFSGAVLFAWAGMAATNAAFDARDVFK